MKLILAGACCTMALAAYANAETLTIATVNNGDMIRMQGLTDDFTEKTGHQVEWVTLEENVLRQRVTTDITTKGGAFDIMTIGMYETPIWGANGWLVPFQHQRRRQRALHVGAIGHDGADCAHVGFHHDPG